MGKDVVIFISYALDDSSRMRIPEIANLLSKMKNIAEVSYWEGWKGYPDGNIRKFMENNIQNADIFIPFCTQASNISQNCQKERDMALFQNKRIIPLFETFSQVPTACQPYLGVDISGKGLGQICDEIHTRIHNVSSAPPKPVKRHPLLVKYDMSAKDVEVMTKLEQILSQPIHEVKSVTWKTFGVRIAKSKIVGLGLYNCGFKEFPEILNQLRSIKKLGLAHNQLTVLPVSLGQLGTLEWLVLSNNQLQSLPDSLGNLHNKGYFHNHSNPFFFFIFEIKGTPYQFRHS